MGSRWGINRTVGQIYALIFVSQRAYQRRRDRRGAGVQPRNVSMGPKELAAGSGLRHQPGDRASISRPRRRLGNLPTLAEERRRREIEPTLSMLRMALLEEPSTDANATPRRMRQMHELIERLMTWFDDVQRWRPRRRCRWAMGSTVTRVLEFKDVHDRAQHQSRAGDLTWTPAAVAHPVRANISFHILFPTITIALAGCCCSSGCGPIPSTADPGGALAWEQAYLLDQGSR